MIRKVATIPGFSIVQSAVLMMILAGVATVNAQQTEPQQPANGQSQTEQQPANGQPQAQQQPNQNPSSQEPSTQEPSTEELGTHKKKPKDYKNWSFNAGGGASLTSGTTGKYVRGGGPLVGAGVARNANKYFGLRLDFQFNTLPLRYSALQEAQAPGANSHVYTLNLGPVVNIPVNRDWGGYIVGGASFYHRSGKLDSSTAVPGSACNGFFLWWGHCYAASLPINGDFLHSSLNQFGVNFGGGITRKITSNLEIFGEFRLQHGSREKITTDFHPITVGLRW
jgi:hypothetical protein